MPRKEIRFGVQLDKNITEWVDEQAVKAMRSRTKMVEYILSEYRKQKEQEEARK